MYDYLYAYMQTHTYAYLDTVKAKTRRVLVLQWYADINTELQPCLAFGETNYSEKLK